MPTPYNVAIIGSSSLKHPTVVVTALNYALSLLPRRPTALMVSHNSGVDKALRLTHWRLNIPLKTFRLKRAHAVVSLWDGDSQSYAFREMRQTLRKRFRLTLIIIDYRNGNYNLFIDTDPAQWCR